MEFFMFQGSILRAFYANDDAHCKAKLVRETAS